MIRIIVSLLYLFIPGIRIWQGAGQQGIVPLLNVFINPARRALRPINITIPLLYLFISAIRSRKNAGHPVIAPWRYLFPDPLRRAFRPVHIIILLLYLFLPAFSLAQTAQKLPASTLPAAFAGDSAMRSAHLGWSVYDPVAGKYLYDYQGDKYFVPASNVKILTCYTAMKYLPPVLPGIRYYENDTAFFLLPTADPTLLHRDYTNQPVIRFLQQQSKKLYVSDYNWQDEELGNGWSWDDYRDEYMTEKNALPVYGNTVKWIQEGFPSPIPGEAPVLSVRSDPEVPWRVRFTIDTGKNKFQVERERLANIFSVTEGPEKLGEVTVPFMVNGIRSALELLPDTVGKTIEYSLIFPFADVLCETGFLQRPGLSRTDCFPRDSLFRVIRSQPIDSVLRPMMFKSDNFLAEQLLLMLSDEMLGVMNDEQVIDSLLRAALHDLPQKPVWVDGSGLSRYNLLTPRSYVAVLDKMRREFGMERIRSIFPSGGEGTLQGYYLHDKKRIYAKTGSMSGVITLSGFMYTRQNKLLLFSVMINNYTGKTSVARRAIERFIRQVRNSH